MTFAIHNWHTPAVEIDDEKRVIINGQTRANPGEPLFVAETREEAEAWRVAMRDGVSTPVSTGGAA